MHTFFLSELVYWFRRSRGVTKLVLSLVSMHYLQDLETIKCAPSSTSLSLSLSFLLQSKVAVFLLPGTKAVRYCSEKLSITFSNISSWTNYRYRLSIFWEPLIIFRYGDDLPIIFYIERHPLNINCNSYIETKLWAMSSKPVVIKLDCDLKETQTNHVRSKLSDILKV
jgi:hypothetical protein